MPAKIDAAKVDKQFEELRTFMEEMRDNMLQQFSNLNSELSGKIDAVQSATDVLKNRVDEVDTNLTKRVESLEGKQSDDMKNLIATTAAISTKIEIYKDTMHNEVTDLRDQLRAQKLQNVALSLSYNACVNRIDDFKSQIEDLERSSHGGIQHTRGWNIEIDGIPDAVGDERDNLEKAVIKIIRGIGVEVGENEIESVHRLPARKDDVKPTIVRFHGRKIVHKIHEKKKKLKNLSDLGIIVDGLRPDSKIYIRANQCPYYKQLSYNCRMLKRANKIMNVIVGKDGKTTIKTLNNRFVKILHASDLTSRFPDFQDFSFKPVRSHAEAIGELEHDH